MPISRLRLRLAAWFAIAVLVAVSAVDLGLSVYLRRQADQRFSDDLRAAAEGMLRAVRQEERETGAPPRPAAADALSEWPAGPEAFRVYAADGGVVGERGTPALLAVADLPGPDAPSGHVWSHRLRPRGAARLAVARDDVLPALTVVAVHSTADLREYAEVLTGWLWFSVPGVTVFALIAGYLLARRALRQLAETADAIARIEPSDLAGRLPVREPPDEIDRLAVQFNALLTRLAEARERNQAFLSRVAHQLRTPLTVVRGESALGLERERNTETYREILARVARAAEQMGHRVDDLFLLARAEAGDRPPLTDAVELDGLALECTDLMRGRAQAAGRTLELERVGADTATGNEPLLREALLELLENAIRHGDGAAPIRVSAYVDNAEAHLEVVSTGPEPPSAADAHPRSDGRGLGLSIVRWIAGAHGGVLVASREGKVNRFGFAWPVHPRG